MLEFRKLSSVVLDDFGGVAALPQPNAHSNAAIGPTDNLNPVRQLFFINAPRAVLPLSSSVMLSIPLIALHLSCQCAGYVRFPRLRSKPFSFTCGARIPFLIYSGPVFALAPNL